MRMKKPTSHGPVFMVEEENLVAVITEEEFKRSILPLMSWDRLVVFAVRTDDFDVRGHYLAWFDGVQWVKIAGEPIV